MTAVLKKEFNAFFASPIAYLVIGFFLTINGLFLWVFEDDFNILNAGFADINSFFYLAPWLLLFLAPAVTMRSFSDEIQSGTIETLLTKPIASWHVVWGKFFAVFLLLFVAILPTLVYVFSVSELGSPVGNIDLGSTFGSYLGLMLLAGAFASVGLFSSTLSNNQIVAFLVGVLLCFFLFYGFDATASLFGPAGYTVQLFGFNEHFKSMGRGVLDSRDLLYFVSIIAVFLTLTKHRIIRQQARRPLMLLVFGLLVVNIFTQGLFVRLDLTQDKRYTNASVTKDILNRLEDRLFIRVYLEGDFPAEFKRLQLETKQFLEELKRENSKISIQFVNPDDQRERLIKSGMNPSQLTVEENGKLSNALIFPWAEIDYQNKTSIVSLLPLGIVRSQDQQMQNAIENLEYSFANAIHTIVQKSQKKIAVVTGNGQLEDPYLYSWLSELTKKYRLGKITLDSVAANPTKTLQNLSNFDLALVAKPTQKFTESEKLVLDQFVMGGGKSLWLLDNVQADTDSLYNSGKMLAYPRDLNLTDLLFAYGVRINSALIQDLYAAKIPLATGNIGNQSQFQNLPWFYHPLVAGNPYHPITKNLAPVRMRFANPIDTLENAIEKTPLLVSSPLTKITGTPAMIALQSIAKEPKENEYKGGYQLMGVLLEGRFNSNYKGRIKPFTLNNYKDQSPDNKMIVISDGDIAKNQLLKGQPFDLSTDKWTNEQFGNKEFLRNAVDYLLDDTGLITLRNKTLQINLLDKKRAFAQRSYWQTINVVVPLVLLFIFGAVFNLMRRKKYAR